MKPKDKAKELIDKYQAKPIIEYTACAGCNTEYSKLNNREAIECALICVDEILRELKELHHKTPIFYWQEVNKEIEKQ